MNKTAITMGQYRAVLAAAEQMLGYARRDAWGDVSKTAIAIGGLTNRLRSVDPESFDSDEARDERLRVLTRLVEIDAEVRALRDPWVANLDQMLAPSNRRRYSNPMGSAGVESE